MVQSWEIGTFSGYWKSNFDFRNPNAISGRLAAELDEILALVACIRTDVNTDCEGFARSTSTGESLLARGLNRLVAGE